MNKNKKQNESKKREVDKRLGHLLSEKDTNARDGVIADPNGSYTGVAYPKHEKPIQDADDL